MFGVALSCSICKTWLKFINRDDQLTTLSILIKSVTIKWLKFRPKNEAYFIKRQPTGVILLLYNFWIFWILRTYGTLLVKNVLEIHQTFDFIRKSLKRHCVQVRISKLYSSWFSPIISTLYRIESPRMSQVKDKPTYHFKEEPKKLKSFYLKYLISLVSISRK